MYYKTRSSPLRKVIRTSFSGDGCLRCVPSFPVSDVIRAGCQWVCLTRYLISKFALFAGSVGKKQQLKHTTWRENSACLRFPFCFLFLCIINLKLRPELRSNNQQSNSLSTQGLANDEGFPHRKSYNVTWRVSEASINWYITAGI